MRKITFGPIALFSALLLLILTFGVGSTLLVLRPIPLGDYRGVVTVGLGTLLIYLYAFAVYRLFLKAMPLREGPIAEGSREEFGYHVYLLFYLILFYPLTRSRFIPVPLMRLVYQALGAKLGPNTYSSGTILDPPLTFIGANTIIGQDAVLYSHAIEGSRLSHHAIRIGDNVTIGANAVVMAGVTIDSDVIVAAGAVVMKGANLNRGEVWGGVPAKQLGGGANKQERPSFPGQ
jgi:acetyltransferase-like isoleucine patch superfamily enzyme